MCDSLLLGASAGTDLMEPSAGFAAVSVTHPFPQPLRLFFSNAENWPLNWSGESKCRAERPFLGLGPRPSCQTLAQPGPPSVLRNRRRGRDSHRRGRGGAHGKYSRRSPQLWCFRSKGQSWALGIEDKSQGSVASDWTRSTDSGLSFSA